MKAMSMSFKVTYKHDSLSEILFIVTLAATGFSSVSGFGRDRPSSFIRRDRTKKKRPRQQLTRFGVPVREVTKSSTLMRSLDKLINDEPKVENVQVSSNISYIRSSVPEMMRLLSEALDNDDSCPDDSNSTVDTSTSNDSVAKTVKDAPNNEKETTKDSVTKRPESFIINPNQSAPPTDNLNRSVYYLEISMARSLAVHIIEDSQKELLSSLGSSEKKAKDEPNASGQRIKTEAAVSSQPDSKKIDPSVFIHKVVQLAEQRVNILETLWPEIIVAKVLVLELENELPKRNISGLLNEFKKTKFYELHNTKLDEKAGFLRRRVFKFFDEITDREVLPVVNCVNTAFFETGRKDHISLAKYQAKFGFYEAVMKDKDSNPFQWYEIPKIIERAVYLIGQWRKAGSTKGESQQNKPNAKLLSSLAPYLENIYSWSIIHHVCWNSLLQYRNAVVKNKWDRIYHLREMALSTIIEAKDLKDIAFKITGSDSMSSVTNPVKANIPIMPNLQLKREKVLGFGASKVIRSLDFENNWFNKYKWYVESGLYAENSKARAAESSTVPVKPQPAAAA